MSAPNLNPFLPFHSMCILVLPLPISLVYSLSIFLSRMLSESISNRWKYFNFFSSLPFVSTYKNKFPFVSTHKNKFSFVSKISLPSEQRVCLFCVALWFSFIFSVIIFQALLIVCALFIYTVTAETEEGQSGRSRVSDEQLNMALSDQRYLRRQLKCALGEAPCDPVGRRLKSKYYVYSARTN